MVRVFKVATNVFSSTSLVAMCGVGHLSACRRRHSKAKTSLLSAGNRRNHSAHAVAPHCMATHRDTMAVPHGQGAGCCVITSTVDGKTVLSQLQSDVVLLVSCVKSDVN